MKTENTNQLAIIHLRLCTESVQMGEWEKKDEGKAFVMSCQPHLQTSTKEEGTVERKFCVNMKEKIPAVCHAHISLESKNRKG